MPSCLPQKILSRQFFPRWWVSWRWRLPISIVTVLAIIELVLRLGYGLGNPVLLQTDAYTGYRFQPNQQVVRFGKRIQYNQFSQRSDPITIPKPADVLRILILGDSVINGGAPIDQTETTTELLEAMIRAKGRSIEVLNASAGSWGIGNQLGYLQQFGTLDSDAVVLEIGAHDLYQPTSTSQRVGKDPDYPDRRPWLALQELWVRYLLPRVLLQLPRNPITTEIPASFDPEVTARSNRQHLRAAIAIIQRQQLPLWILFIPGYPQAISATPPIPYKSDFLQLMQALQVPVINIQSSWLALPQPTVASYFRDEVHLTVAGNQAVAASVFQAVCPQDKPFVCALDQEKPIF